MRRILVLLILPLIAACGDTATGQQTLVAYDSTMQTARAAFAATSTADMEGLLVTLDASERQLTRVAEQRGRIISTLDANGIQVDFMPLSAVAPTDVEPPSTFGPSPTPSPNFSPTPTDVQVTPLRPTPQATRVLSTQPPPIPDSPLQNVVMAQNIGDDDCATTVTNQFSPDDERIYVVARAQDIQPGTTIRSRWQDAAGTTLATFDFTPDFEIEDACIWFFVTAEDFDFANGSYTVTLLVNDDVASPPIPFTIVVPVTPSG